MKRLISCYHTQQQTSSKQTGTSTHNRQALTLASGACNPNKSPDSGMNYAWWADLTKQRSASKIRFFFLPKQLRISPPILQGLAWVVWGACSSPWSLWAEHPYSQRSPCYCPLFSSVTGRKHVFPTDSSRKYKSSGDIHAECMSQLH